MSAPTTAGGIVGYGTYIPYHRLDRADIAAALGVPAGRGSRSVASFDEDTTSLAVEAARAAVAATGAGAGALEALAFSTVDPAYCDKTNATAVHAALGLPRSVPAADRHGSIRSAVLALFDAVGSSGRRRMLTVVSDIRTGLAGGADETSGGDAAAAFVTGTGTAAGPVLAEHLSVASATGEFLDRWRTPGSGASKVWEERFGEHAYRPLVEAAFGDALARAGMKASEVDHLVVAGSHPRAVARFVASAGVAREAVAPDFREQVGFAGAAHLGLMLADVLDQARPGAVIAAVSVADGADVLVLRATDAVEDHRRSGRHVAVRAQIDSGRHGLAYTSYLSWRGLLRREPPRRPDPVRPAAPPSLRSAAWKFGLEGSRCTAAVDGGEECGTRHLPPQPVCMRCRSVGRMVPERFADVPGTVSTFTVDRLAHSPSPPLVAAVVDFDGGGRYRFEMTDVDARSVSIGDRVEMTFRRLYEADGVQDYFWKARPVR